MCLTDEEIGNWGLTCCKIGECLNLVLGLIWFEGRMRKLKSNFPVRTSWYRARVCVGLVTLCALRMAFAIFLFFFWIFKYTHKIHKFTLLWVLGGYFIFTPVIFLKYLQFTSVVGELMNYTIRTLLFTVAKMKYYFVTIISSLNFVKNFV